MDDIERMQQDHEILLELLEDKRKRDRADDVLRRTERVGNTVLRRIYGESNMLMAQQRIS